MATRRRLTICAVYRLGYPIRFGLLPTALWYDALLWLLVISPPPVAGRARDWASRAQTMLTLLTQKAAFVWHNRVSRRALQYDRPRF
jgi:hypothetical protein